MSYFFTFKILLQTLNKYLQISVFSVECFLIPYVVMFYSFVMIFYFLL